MDGHAKHLVAAAYPNNRCAARHQPENLSIPSGFLQISQIADGGFGAWQYDQVWIAKIIARFDVTQANAPLAFQWIEVVEISDVTKRDHGDVEADLGPHFQCPALF
jgi:hypothetical protein